MFATTDEDDLPETIRELSDVAASWRNIGTQLGIRHNRLEAIQGDKPLDCLRQMLATWLQKNYNVKRFGEPTWLKLVEVVSHSAGGGNPSLAMEIARRHKGVYGVFFFLIFFPLYCHQPIKAYEDHGVHDSQNDLGKGILG